MYALERLFAASGKTGTDLTNFNALMGGGMIQTLQKYQNAARQVGISNEEMEGTFKSLSDLASKTLLGKARPEGAAYVANRTKTDLNPLLKAAADGHPELLLQKLQEFALVEKNIGMRNQVLKSFGLGDNMIAGMAQGAFTPQAIAKNVGGTYSDSETKRLNDLRKDVANLENKIEKAVGHFAAENGGKLIKDISGITDKVLAMAKSFVDLANKIDLLKGVGKIFEGWGYIFDGVTSAVTALEEFLAKQDKEKGKTDSIWDKNIGGANESIAGKIPLKVEWEKLPSMFETFIHGIFDGKKPTSGEKVPTSKTQDASPPATPPAKRPPEPEYTDDVMINVKRFNAYQDQLKRLGLPPVLKAPTVPVGAVKAPTVPPAALRAKPEAQANLRLAVPPSPVAPTPAAAAAPTVAPSLAGGVTTQNINVNQNLNFSHEGKDAARTGDSTKKAVTAAFRQMSAQGQGT